MRCKCYHTPQERLRKMDSVAMLSLCMYTDSIQQPCIYQHQQNIIFVQYLLTFVDIVEIVESFSRSSFLSFSISVLAWWTSASLAEFSLCNPLSKVVDCIFCLLSFSLSLVNWAILRSFSAISVRKEAILFVVAFGSVLTQVVALGYNENIAFY